MTQNVVHLLQAVTALLVASQTILGLVLNKRFKRLKRNVNGRIDELIQAHRLDAYRQGILAGERGAKATEGLALGNEPRSVIAAESEQRSQNRP